MARLVGPAVLLALLSAVDARAQTVATRPATAKPEQAIQEVVVVAPTAQKQTRIDRTVYSVAGDLQAASGTAADVLNNVPSVAVDPDGGISLRGDPNVTILIDGKPSAQFSGPARGLSLLQLPGSEIARVEVLSNPPAQFKAEGTGGVINIVTKKTGKAGLSGAGQFTVGENGRYVAGLDGTYNVGKLRMSAGLGWRREIRERVTTFQRDALDPATNATASSQQATDEHFRRSIPSVKASVDYDLNDRQSLGGSFSRRELNGVRTFDQRNLDGPPGRTPAADSNRHSDGREWAGDTSQGVHFDQKLWRPGETLALALQSSASRERERYAYRNSFAIPAGAPTFDDLYLSFDLLKTEFSADYDLPLPKERELKLGYDLESDRNIFDDVAHTLGAASGPVTATTANNHFRYRQTVNAAYAQYETPLGPWRLQAGLRLEAADVSTVQLVGNVAGGRRDFGAYPSVHLDRSVGETGKLSASVSRRIDRPDPEALNPYLDQQDTHNLRAGNPDLLPQDTWSYEVGYTAGGGRFSYGATAYVHVDRNSVTDILRPISADVVLSTRTNLPRSRSAGLEFSLGGALGPKVSYSLSANAFSSQIDASALGYGGLRSTTGLNLKANVDFRFTRADTLQVSVTRSDKRLTPQGYVAAINLVNLGYRRQLRPDLALVLTVSDALDGQRVRRLVNTAQLRDDYLRTQNGRVLLAGLTYTFGAQKKAKPSRFEYEQ